MNRRDYLVRTFSRTKRKDYENYVLTAIWHKLDNLNILPASQQYIKRANGSFALMDLYFPQLHIGVEVDEAHHKNQKHMDELRMDDIIASISEEEIDDFLCLRVDVTQSIEEIDQQIREAVTIIRKRASTIELHWLTYEEQLVELKEKEVLSVYDDVSFMNIKDIANTIFGKQAKGYQRSCFRIYENTWLWCPKLSIEVDGVKKSVANGWINTLASDWSYIDESHESTEIVEARKNGFQKEVEQNQKRAVFAKYKDILGHNRYRFIGIFKCTGLAPGDSTTIRYERIEEQVSIL
ncbi:hypothetical protein JSY36_05290 [Bacillus sp. H-16]|uniref:AbaSI family restriction endonuclease n=1 Tax=Alteribacter salitolerans TaxID=2912333 RepID=UPI0019626A48|nr:hypothetical protein [Alteribacter salitolerans]MBM7095166.1 hypothetical protein [Alteribacter salitolerans]